VTEEISEFGFRISFNRTLSGWRMKTRNPNSEFRNPQFFNA